MKSPQVHLLHHLIAEKKVSGPPTTPEGLEQIKKIINLKPEDWKNKKWIGSINNSGLGTIKRILCGTPPFLGDERYLLFGSELHARAMQPKLKRPKWVPFDENEKLAMEGGLKSLFKCDLFNDSMQGAVIEELKHKKDCFGVWHMHGTLDISKKLRRAKRGVDLKTTSAATESEFISKCIKLGYPRQGSIYCELDGCTEFFFIGISKKNNGTISKPNYPIFIFDLNNYAEEKKQATEEAKFLLSFYRDFGLPIEKAKYVE